MSKILLLTNSGGGVREALCISTPCYLYLLQSIPPFLSPIKIQENTKSTIDKIIYNIIKALPLFLFFIGSSSYFLKMKSDFLFLPTSKYKIATIIKIGNIASKSECSGITFIPNKKFNKPSIKYMFKRNVNDISIVLENSAISQLPTLTIN